MTQTNSDISKQLSYLSPNKPIAFPVTISIPFIAFGTRAQTINAQTIKPKGERHVSLYDYVSQSGPKLEEFFRNNLKCNLAEH